MTLKIHALEGPLKGQKFTLKTGLRIGRTKGDIRLDDKKVSSLHAFVSGSAKDGFILHDNGSKNGLRDDKQKVQTITLDAGARFYIGDSHFVVEGPPELKPQAEAPTQIASTPAKDFTEPTKVSAKDEIQVEVPIEQKKWHEVLEEFSVEKTAQIENHPRAVVPLDPAIELNFTRGIQAETRWVLGYGPRRAGSGSIDLPLFEPSIPELTFEVIPSVEGVTFRTPHPKTVLLNGKSIASNPLRDGDVIEFGETRIEVGFIT